MQKFSKLFMALALVSVFIACKKEKPADTPTTTGNSNASYEVILNGDVLIKNSSGYASISESINDTCSAIHVLDKFTTNVDDLKESISITNINNLKVGATMEVKQSGATIPTIDIVPDFAAQESYSVTEGTVTREAENKLTFKATKVVYAKMGVGAENLDVNISGSVTSDIIKQIGKYHNY